MAKYALSFKHLKGNYQPIFWNLLYSKNINITSLEYIDKFTSQFNDENAIKNLLVDNFYGVLAGTIEPDDLSKGIVITSKKNSTSKEQTVPYGVCYKNDLPYINYSFLKSYVISRIFDKEFLRRFANHFYGMETCRESVSIILNTLTKYKDYDLRQIDKKYYENAVLDLLQFNVYGVHCEVDDFLTGRRKMIDPKRRNYSALRNIGMFISSIETKKDLEQTKLKELEKKEEVVQTSLFDILEHKKD